MCIIDCLSTIVFILPLYLDDTKVIILILWRRTFQLEYWRTFQLVSTFFKHVFSEKGALSTAYPERNGCYHFKRIDIHAYPIAVFYISHCNLLIQLTTFISRADNFSDIRRKHAKQVGYFKQCHPYGSSWHSDCSRFTDGYNPSVHNSLYLSFQKTPFYIFHIA